MDGVDESMRMVKWIPKGAVALSVPYGFVLASIFLIAYWSPVGINPFHYANAADLISATIGAISLFLLFLAGVTLAGIYASKPPPFDRLISLVGDGKPKLWKFVLLFAIMLALSGLALWRLYVNGEFVLLASLALGLAVLLIFVVSGHVKLSDPVHHKRSMALLILVCLVPGFAWKHGSVLSERALDGKKGLVVDTKRSEIGLPVTGRVMYVGMLGDFHVLREIESSSTILVPSDSRMIFSRGSSIVGSQSGKQVVPVQ